MTETPHQTPEDNLHIVERGIAFLSEDELIRFEQVELLMSDIVLSGKTLEFLSAVTNCPTINDGRKLMVIQILVIRCSRLFSTEAYRGLVLLLGFYTRQARDPYRYHGETVVPYSSAPSLIVQIREHTSIIIRESRSLLTESEADTLLAAHPFYIENSERARILAGVYIHDV